MRFSESKIDCQVNYQNKNKIGASFKCISCQNTDIKIKTFKQ